MMEKVMNKPITAPLAKEQVLAKKLKSPNDNSAEFAAELSQLGAQMGVLAAPQPLPQPVAAPSNALGGETAEAPAQAASGSAVNLNQTTVSSNTVSDRAGLKPGSSDLKVASAIDRVSLPGMDRFAIASKGWVFQNEAPEIEGTESLSLSEAFAQEIQSLQAAVKEASKEGKSEAQSTAKRGEAEAALNEKSALLKSPLENNAGQQANPKASLGATVAESQSNAGSQNIEMLSRMGGEIQASTPETRVPAKGQVKSTGLSGSEFLDTLNAAKGQSPRGAGLESQFQKNGEKSDGQLTGGGQSELRPLSAGLKEKGKVKFATTLDAQSGPREMTLPQVLGNPSGASLGSPVAHVTGHVVQGANAEDRLSSEALLGMSNGIRNFSAQGGGEMRIRLKPENLGELHVRVVTDGKNVGLQIQASHENAKKILEESMSHLKESMASQNLSLGAVDLTVAQSSRSDTGSTDSQSQGQGMYSQQDMLGQQQAGGGRSGGFGREDWQGGETDSVARPVRTTASSVSRQAAAALGAQAARAEGVSRLDVKA